MIACIIQCKYLVRYGDYHFFLQHSKGQDRLGVACSNDFTSEELQMLGNEAQAFLPNLIIARQRAWDHLLLELESWG